MNSSGQISLAGTIAGQSIEIENGGNGTTQISLNDPPVRALAGVPSGQIVMPNDFWGKSNTVNLTVEYLSNTPNANINISQLSGYVAGKTKVTVEIRQDVIMYSTSLSNAGFVIGGGTAGDEILINNHGYIIGCGGSGGAGAYVPNQIATYPGNPGGNGGLAMNMTFPVGMNNYNTIAGGGGGGGAGMGSCIPGGLGIYKDSFGGGGGGGGQSNGAAGAGGQAQQNGGDPCPPGNPGSAGTPTGVGQGGSGNGGGSTSGAAGGKFGASGVPASGNGGAGGPAITKNGNVLALYISGIILGAVS